MPRLSAAALAAAFLMAVAAAPAAAIVTYTLELPRGRGGFVWQAPDYVRQGIAVSARLLRSCNSGPDPACVAVYFEHYLYEPPAGAPVRFDRIGFVTTTGGPFLYFDRGAFIGPGRHDSRLFNLGAVLTVASDGIPEPSTWVLLIGGFAVAGAMQRRDRMAI